MVMYLFSWFYRKILCSWNIQVLGKSSNETIFHGNSKPFNS